MQNLYKIIFIDIQELSAIKRKSGHLDLLLRPLKSWIQVERLFESTGPPWLELPVSVGQVRPRG